MWNHSIKFKKSSRRSLPLDTSFSIWGRFFPPSIKIKYVIASLVVSSLKLLEDHLCSKDFAQTVGNISKAFCLAIIEKAYVKDVLQKSLQEVVELKGQLQHVHDANWQDYLTIQHMQIELQELKGTKKVPKLEIKNFNYQNELLNLHKKFIKINKMLGSINSKRAKFKQAFEQEKPAKKQWSNF